MEGPSERYLPALKRVYEELIDVPSKQREAERKEAWREWFLAGKVPDNKPKNLRPTPDSFTDTATHELYREWDRKKAEYLATPEGRDERAMTLLEQVAKDEAYYRMGLEEPYRFHLGSLEPHVERLLKKCHAYCRHLITGHEVGGPDELLRRYDEELERLNTDPLTAMSESVYESSPQFSKSRSGKSYVDGDEEYSPLPPTMYHLTFPHLLHHGQRS